MWLREVEIDTLSVLGHFWLTHIMTDIESAQLSAGKLANPEVAGRTVDNAAFVPRKLPLTGRNLKQDRAHPLTEEKASFFSLLHFW